MEQNINAAFQELRQRLKLIYPDSEADLIADWTIEEVSGLSKPERMLDPQAVLRDSQVLQFRDFSDQLLNHRPVQYVLGYSEFYGLKLKVNEQVLIPRPETEELIDWCLGELRKRGIASGLSILDVGTGSGCIALALKRQLAGADIFAMDISAGALEIAQKNAQELDLPVSFIQWDVLSETEADFLPKLDIIISNPPYILPEEQLRMTPGVLRYEPHMALFVTNNDPLQFYKKIGALALRLLKPGGCLFFELHEDFAQATEDYFLENDWEVVVKKDMQGKTRMMKAEYPAVK